MQDTNAPDKMVARQYGPRFLGLADNRDFLRRHAPCCCHKEETQRNASLECHRKWSPEPFICRTDLTHYRSEYVRSLLESEKGELTSLEEEVLTSLRQHEILTTNVDAEFEPDPFILLNLVLSCLAAIQAPIIMMSQNRQEADEKMGIEYATVSQTSLHDSCNPV